MGCNNLVLNISCKSIVKNIVDVAFFSLFYLFVIWEKYIILFIDYK